MIATQESSECLGYLSCSYCGLSELADFTAWKCNCPEEVLENRMREAKNDVRLSNAMYQVFAALKVTVGLIEEFGGREPEALRDKGIYSLIAKIEGDEGIEVSK